MESLCKDWVELLVEEIKQHQKHLVGLLKMIKNGERAIQMRQNIIMQQRDVQLGYKTQEVIEKTKL